MKESDKSILSPDPGTFEAGSCHSESENPSLGQDLDVPLREFGSQQRLIITLIQEMKRDQEAHHAAAATREDVKFEGLQTRGHTEDQLLLMTKTIAELRAYIKANSVRRRLIIYSSVLLITACLLLVGIIVHGPMTISSPFPEMAVIVSLAFLLMSRYAPNYKR